MIDLVKLLHANNGHIEYANLEGIADLSAEYVLNHR